jgi:RNA polymerase sigma factor (sigma-70 family)
MVLASDGEGSAAGRLCTLYWLPIYGYLRRDGKSPHDAEDITQDFFYHMLRRKDFGKVRPTGRFRSFLLTALQNHLANLHEHESALKRGGGQKPLAIDTDVAEEHLRLEETAGLDPEKTYDRKWAQALIEHVLRQLALEQESDGVAELFEHLRPLMVADPDAVPAAEIGRKIGKSAGAVRIAVFRLRKRFAKLLRQEVADTVESKELVEPEIDYLLSLFSG